MCIYIYIYIYYIYIHLFIDIYINIHTYIYIDIDKYIVYIHKQICKASYNEKSHLLDIVDDVNSLNIQNEYLLVRFDLINMFSSIDKIFGSRGA